MAQAEPPIALRRSPDKIAGVMPQPVVDYPQQTTRTAVDLVFTGTTARNPDVKILLSHAGGTLPYLAARVAGASALVGPLVSQRA